MPDARIVVVGLGPAGADLVTAGTLELIDRIPHRWVRTRRHPAVSVLGQCGSFDEVYEAADRIDDVYPEIVRRLVASSHELGTILYAVPGAPAVAERTVELLRSVDVAADDVQVEVHAALSFADLTWSRLGVDPLAVSPRILDGHRFALDAAGERGPLLVCQCDSVDVLSDIKLSVDDPPTEPVIVLQRLGLPDESIHAVDWSDLDRLVDPDHLTSLWIPELASPVATELMRFAGLVDALREGCPWDAQQTHESLRRYLLEETYEVLEAIDELDADDPASDDALCEELGDLLFQVFFHARIAAEDGRFDLADVARGVHDKLHARHPHVFGDALYESPEQLAVSWEAAKQTEKSRASLMDGIPVALPALLLALKVQKKAATVGRAATTLAEARIELAAALATLAGLADDEAADGPTAVGEVLFATVEVARHLGVDPEDAARRVASTARSEFQAWEQQQPVGPAAQES